MQPLSRPCLRARVVLAPLLALLLLGLAPSAPALARAADQDPPTSTSGNPDETHLPLKCASEEDKVPREPLLCRLNAFHRSAPTIVIVGDSHAWMLTPALEAAAAHRRVNLVGFFAGACPVVDPGFRSLREIHSASDCQGTGALALRYVEHAMARHATIRVMVATAFELYRSNLHPGRRGPVYTDPYLQRTAKLMVRGTPSFFRALGRSGAPVDVVAPMPILPTDSRQCPADQDDLTVCTVPRDVALRSEAANDRYVRRMTSYLTGRHRIVEASRFFCDDIDCYGMTHDVPSYWNRLHIGARASRLLGPAYFGPTVRAVLAARRHQRG